MARSARIHPAIGIARLGTSEQPDGFFIGPEVPNLPVIPADGFRDAGGALKRQGARFRVFLEDVGDRRELTATDAEITWTIEVANRKAAGDRFRGIADPVQGPRNATFAQRDLLVLAAPKRTLAGPHQSVDLINQTAFMGFPVPVTLATAKTDADGNLIVLGGFGKSASPNGTPLNSPGSNFANHDGWFDDICDGRISATVRMRDGSESPTVVSSWVVTAPPKFVPTVLPVVTLYDTLRELAIDRGTLASPFDDQAFRPSFTNDILPIIARARGVRWLWANNDPSPVTTFHRSMATIPPTARNQIFGKLRKPAASPTQPGTGLGNMPRIWSDLYPNGKNGTLTRLQYRMMEEWKNGNFIDDFLTAPPPDPTSITPDGLDQAALDACVGAAFYPGIEVSWKVREEFRFIEPFRFDPTAIRPGDVTAQMSLPWQSDFLDCAVESGNFTQALTWWPSQRPLDIRQRADGPPVSWARAFDGPDDLTVEQMIEEWSRLGFILPDGDALLETDRR